MKSSTSDIMERPAKRARVSSPNEPPHEELADWDLQAARARNDLNLKSIFEGIFAKYSKDFTEEGDEIDLQTGEIIVDHGHLLGMHEEGGSNEATEAWNYEAARQARKSADTDAEDQDVGDDEDSANLSEDDEDDLVASESDKEADICRPSDSAPPGPILDKPDATPVLPQDTFEQFNKIVAPIDPIWEAPELPVFSTPTAETRRVQVPPNLPNLRREPSPPGSGSLWAIPKRGRPFTEGKPRATPSKTRPRAKRKHHSSPVAYDWSFAAMTEDDDSDDPLQEEQPSPSVLKLKSWNIRGKTTNPPTLTCSPLARQPLPGPSKTKPPEPPQHQSTTDAAHNQEDKARHKSYLQSYVASARPYSLKSTTAPGTAGGPTETTPTRSRRPLSLDEARLVVRLRYVEKKKWHEISDQMGRSINTLCVWHRNHWLDPRDNPPKLSTPWTQQELQVLGHFTDRAELSWAEIKKEVPHRSKAEIEFELIRMWVGDKAWGNERESFKQVENESGEPEAPAPQPCDKPANASNKSPREHVADTSSIYGEISEGAALPDDDYDPFATISSAESSPSKLSAIRMDNTIQLKNCPPKRHSPVKQLESTQ